jgi:hypothetical protein
MGIAIYSRHRLRIIPHWRTFLFAHFSSILHTHAIRRTRCAGCVRANFFFFSDVDCCPLLLFAGSHCNVFNVRVRPQLRIFLVFPPAHSTCKAITRPHCPARTPSHLSHLLLRRRARGTYPALRAKISHARICSCASVKSHGVLCFFLLSLHRLGRCVGDGDAGLGTWWWGAGCSLVG